MLKKNELLKNDNFQRALVSFFMLIVSLLAVVVTYRYLRVPEEKVSKEEIVEQLKDAIVSVENDKIPTQYPDYSALSRMKKVELLTKFESWTPDARKDPAKTKSVLVLDGGRLSTGYLYVKASVEDRPMSRWESIFVQMNYKGGHLLRSKSLPVPPGDMTELLYALDDVSYISSVPYQENSNYSKVNWFNQFNPGSRIRVDTFISSLKPAVIEELVIFYDCADNDQCSLKVQ